MTSAEFRKRRKRRRWLSIAALLLVAVLVWAAISTSRLGYETAEYEVREKNGDLELRSYEAMSVISTPVGEARGRQGMDGGFGRLFRYITGSNEASQKVAMTTPVLMDGGPAGESKMSFLLPAAVAASGAPAPSGDQVQLRDLNAGDLAAIRFHGFREEEAIRAAEEELRAWIEARGWSVVGDSMLAYYDPPWTPEFLRRNEVLIRVDR